MVLSGSRPRSSLCRLVSQFPSRCNSSPLGEAEKKSGLMHTKIKHILASIHHHLLLLMLVQRAFFFDTKYTTDSGPGAIHALGWFGSRFVTKNR